MDLYCTPPVKIGYIGSSFFAGTVLGSFILPRAGDIIGRRPVHLLGLVIFICVVFASLFNTSLTFCYFLLFMGGISETGRYYVAYVYCVEFFPKNVQSKVGLGIFAVFGVAMTLIGLRFWFVVPRIWTWNAYIALVLAFISLIACVGWMPESPRFLYSRKKYAETEAIINKMA
jgi:putative MFS transporter